MMGTKAMTARSNHPNPSEWGRFGANLLGLLSISAIVGACTVDEPTNSDGNVCFFVNTGATVTVRDRTELPKRVAEETLNGKFKACFGTAYGDPHKEGEFTVDIDPVDADQWHSKTLNDFYIGLGDNPDKEVVLDKKASVNMGPLPLAATASAARDAATAINQAATRLATAITDGFSENGILAEITEVEEQLALGQAALTNLTGVIAAASERSDVNATELTRAREAERLLREAIGNAESGITRAETELVQRTELDLAFLTGDLQSKINLMESAADSLELVTAEFVGGDDSARTAVINFMANVRTEIGNAEATYTVLAERLAQARLRPYVDAGLVSAANDMIQDYQRKRGIAERRIAQAQDALNSITVVGLNLAGLTNSGDMALSNLDARDLEMVLTGYLADPPTHTDASLRMAIVRAGTLRDFARDAAADLRREIGQAQGRMDVDATELADAEQMLNDLELEILEANESIAQADAALEADANLRGLLDQLQDLIDQIGTSTTSNPADTQAILDAIAAARDASVAASDAARAAAEGALLQAEENLRRLSWPGQFTLTCWDGTQLVEDCVIREVNQDYGNYPAYGQFDRECTTDATGACTIPYLAVGPGLRFRVQAPGFLDGDITITLTSADPYRVHEIFLQVRPPVDSIFGQDFLIGESTVRDVSQTWFLVMQDGSVRQASVANGDNLSCVVVSGSNFAGISSDCTQLEGMNKGGGCAQIEASLDLGGGTVLRFVSNVRVENEEGVGDPTGAPTPNACP